MNKALENNLRVISIPALAFVGMVILFIFAGSFVWGKVSSLINDYNSAQKTQAMLMDKLTSLQNNQGKISDFAQSLISALPDRNSSLEVISQLKSIALENSVTLVNFQVGAETTENQLSHVDVSVDTQGPNAGIFNFMDQTKTFAPLNKVVRFKLTTSGGQSLGNVTVRAYWAVLPTKIPAVSDPLQKITPEEESLLGQLSALRQPQFVELSPVPGAGKTNPFSL